VTAPGETTNDTRAGDPAHDDAPTRPAIWLLLLPVAVIAAAAVLTPTSELSLNQGDVGLYLEKARALVAGQVPYRDFPLEYPPAALLPMVLPYLAWPFGGLDVETYRWLFAGWEALLVLLLGIVLARIVGLGGDADAADGRRGVARRLWRTGWRLVAVTIGAALALTFRFDLFPALLLMVAVWAALAGRPAWAGVALGLGILAKLYPLAVVPALAVPWLVPLDPRRLARLGMAIALTVIVGMAPFVVLAGGDALAFLRYQADRGLQVEAIGGGLAVLGGLLSGTRVPMSFGFSAVQVEGPFAAAWLGVLPALTVLGFGFLAWVGWRRIRDEGASGGGVGPSTVASLAFASVLVLLATSKVFSIQYVVWLVPFAAMLRGRQFWLAAAVVALTMPIHPLLYQDLVEQQQLPILVLNVRNALFMALLVWVLRDVAAGPAPGRRGAVAAARASLRHERTRGGR
jgi:Glycosyltransferase family 87